MAEAAVADEPLVLLGHRLALAHVPRASVNLRRSAHASVDDVDVLLRPSEAPTGIAALDAGTPRPDVRSPTPSSTKMPAAGMPLTVDDIERLERPAAAALPSSFAELPDAGAADPSLGAALPRGATVMMAEAAVTDDPLVLLGYPPAQASIPRSALHMTRSDAAEIDDALFLVQRPTPAPVRSSSQSPGAVPSGSPSLVGRAISSVGLAALPAVGPGAQPPVVRPLPGNHGATGGAGSVRGSADRGPAAVVVARVGDPDATALLRDGEVRAAVDAVARERASPATTTSVKTREVAISSTTVSGRGAARSLDD
jgi:hypothetical protein